MLAVFKEHIEQTKLFSEKDKLLVAVSGGVDSVVLIYLLHNLGYQITLAHCNFKLREQSDADEQFVVDLANKLGVQCFVKSFETERIAKEKKESIQLVARNLRYDWFRDLLKEQKCSFLLTAHHLNDSLETFVINLSRGTGLSGLLGIPEKNGYIIRPLLPFSRKQIKQYAIENNINWVEDHTNAQTKYLRNKIRHQVVPVLQELNENFLDNFSKTIANLKQSQVIIDDVGNTLKQTILTEKEGVVAFEISKLLNLFDYKVYLYEICKQYNVTQWNDLYDLLTAQSGKKIITKTHRIVKDRDCLLIYPVDKFKNNDVIYYVENVEKQENCPIDIRVFKGENKNLSKKTIEIDENLVTFPLILRKRKEGDVFYPTKMNGKKKVSKFFKDEKLSEVAKNNTWLLCSEDEIIWVVGLRQDRRFLPKNENNKLIISIL